MRKVLIFITALFVAILGIFVFRDKQKEKQVVAIYNEWSEKRQPLEKELRALQDELKTLNLEYQNLITPQSTTQILFTDLNHQIYSLCYPVMKELGYVGILTVSGSQQPGQQGCLTVDQVEDMKQNGWILCVKWEGEFDKGLGPIVYFPKGSYQADLDVQLAQAGVSIVICEKEDLDSPLQTQYEQGIWHIGAMGSMTERPKAWLREAVANDANITFLIGFEEEHQMYTDKNFIGMLKAIREYVDSGDMVVCNPEKAKEHYYVRETGISPEVEVTYQQAKAMLESKIKEVKEQLKEIDAQYQ